MVGVDGLITIVSFGNRLRSTHPFSGGLSTLVLWLLQLSRSALGVVPFVRYARNATTLPLIVLWLTCNSSLVWKDQWLVHHHRLGGVILQYAGRGLVGAVHTLALGHVSVNTFVRRVVALIMVRVTVRILRRTPVFGALPEVPVLLPRQPPHRPWPERFVGS